MRLYHRIKITLLCAALLFCAACATTGNVTPPPTSGAASTPSLKPTQPPEPTPAPDPWEPDPGQFIIDNLNAALSDNMLRVRIFLNNGSGPISAAMLDSECGQDIRDLFSAYDWETSQQPEGEIPPYNGFTVEFYDDTAPYYISFSTYSDVLWLVSADDYRDRLYFRADGAENLCRAVTALCPDPSAQCALIDCPTQEAAEDTAQRFMDDLFATMLENGHITDYELSAFDMIESSDLLIFNVSFRVKAAHPELNLWTSEYSGYRVDESGWTDTLRWKVSLTTNAEQEVYRLDWITRLIE